MTTDEKLAAILAAVQTDPGNRGLARDLHDNLFTATKGDFEAACRSIATDQHAIIDVVTGFLIPTGDQPAQETDGPLGAVFLARALEPIRYRVWVSIDTVASRGVEAGLRVGGLTSHLRKGGTKWAVWSRDEVWEESLSGTPVRRIALERVGPGTDHCCRTMRGLNITDLMYKAEKLFMQRKTSIGIGDGGNEIGMGKIPHETIVKNIPNGDLIHCRVPTDHLIVAGVSNWGAYALAAGVYVLRGVKPPADLFDPDREREILEVMVREGPLVDGVTGQQTATVDGLSWEEYAKPLIRIREILES
ncbi:Putative uncharacterized protein OS=Moorea producens 3L GN=LYNGBM3L_08880 PE=4 SV=1: DUF4392 [Gemmataceae bacterium]|jgi:hypothetical protein|nr:Putative uncharacterized protein OS=Moorea producens 3L GN=LYNGBM3L_08880 PE=4 SV=1: DUF4392 [Gemmataceae bacterium]VTT99710.1 Putative uncharacterized protein OS=Moorea producens 3L GN=LYNGBM3L_08880 PE=4 SV=1: DUF4392 [Gemmataceae bacterium]